MALQRVADGLGGSVLVRWHQDAVGGRGGLFPYLGRSGGHWTLGVGLFEQIWFENGHVDRGTESERWRVFLSNDAVWIDVTCPVMERATIEIRELRPAYGRVVPIYRCWHILFGGSEQSILLAPHYITTAVSPCQYIAYCAILVSR